MSVTVNVLLHASKGITIANTSTAHIFRNESNAGRMKKNQQYFSKNLGIFSEYMAKLIKTELAAFMDKTGIFKRNMRQMREEKIRDQLK